MNKLKCKMNKSVNCFPGIFILFIFFIFLAGLQNSFAQQWIRIFTNGYTPDIRSIAETHDKGYLFIENNYQSNLSWIVKTDINGYKLWDKSIGDKIHYWASANIDQTSDFGYIIGGSTNKYDPSGGGDPSIIKLNPCGEIEWCKVISTPGNYDYADCVRQTPEGQYVMLTSYSDPGFNNRIQIFKFNLNGDLLWKRNILPPSGAFEDDGWDILVLNDGYLVTGECYFPDPGGKGGYERPYYFKTDTAGTVQWQLVYGMMNGFHGYTGVYPTIKSSSGSYYNIALHSNYCDTPSLVKCTESGSESYYQDLYPQACPGGGGPMNFINDTNLVVFVGGTINNQDSSKWSRTDTLGQERFHKQFSSIWIKKTNSSVITFDKKIVSLSKAGANIYLYKLDQNFEYDSIYTSHFTYDSLCPYPIVSDTINPDCGLIVDINEPYTNPESSHMRISPNPAIDRVVLHFPKYLNIPSGNGNTVAQTIYKQWKSTTLMVYDVNGRQCIKQNVSSDLTHLELDVSSWARGMYFLKLIYENHTVDSQKLILK